MRRTLTDSQLQALDFIIDNKPDGYTVREYAGAMGLQSSAAFSSAVASLFMKGYLTVDPKFLEEIRGG